MTRLLISGVDEFARHGLHAAARFADIVSVDCDLDDVVQSVRLDAIDAVVLCPHAGRGRGIDVVHRLRAARLDVGAVLIGAQAPVADVVAWMEVADDCLHGLSDPREVIAKVRAVVRRKYRQATNRIEVGPVTLDSEARRAIVCGSPVPLTGSEFKMLELLMQRSGRVVQKTSILDHLYDDPDCPDPKIIDVYLCKIRHKLVGAGVPAGFVRTIWGQGLTVDREQAVSGEARLAA